MERAVGGNASLIDQLIWILRPAGRDNLLLDPERSCLLQQQSELLDRGGYHDGIGIRCFDLGQLCAHILSGLVHRLDQADLNVVRLEGLAKIFRRAASPVIVDDKEVGFLDCHLGKDVLERRCLDRRRRRDAENVGVAARRNLAR